MGLAVEAAASTADEGHRQVGAGVAVGDGEDVDLVEVVGLLEQAVDAGAQGVGEAQAVERGGFDAGPRARRRSWGRPLPGW